MTLEVIIRQNQGILSQLDKEILDYILSNQDTVMGMSIIELENEVHASKSTIMRLTQKIGFSGFSEFKYFLRQSNLNTNNPPEQKVDLIALQENDIKKTIEYLKSLDLQEMLHTIYQSDMMYCYGTGYSQRKVVEEFSKSMLHFEKKVILLPNKTEFDMAMPMISKKDIVICASLSGETEEIKANLDIIATRNIPIISISAFGDNYFSQIARFVLFYYCTPFMVAKKSQAASSLIGLNVLFDYLFRKYGEYIQNDSSN